MLHSMHWNLHYFYKKINLFNYFKSSHGNKSALEHFLEMDICPYLQPVISAASGKIIGAEVLLRFQDKEGNCYAPGTVIEELEKSHHINTITTKLINNIYEHFSRLTPSLPDNFFFTFNICSTQITNRQLQEAALNFSDRFNMVLEVVERSVLSVDDYTLLAIEEMMNEGIQFAIDDFGAGHTSLKYLEAMNFTFLKIDRDLTMNLQGELLYKKTITALVELARSLNITLIAEGIQNQEQAALLTQNGVGLHQGYYYSRPLALPHFIKQYL